MNEAGFWEYLRNGMLYKWRASRIETSTGSGVPDVAYSTPNRHGWIELKYLRKPPKSKDTIPNLKHFTPIQRLWLRNRGEMAGDCWVFIRMADEFFLFDWRTIPYLSGMPHGEWPTKARGYWETGIDFDELFNVLKVGCKGVW